MVSRRRIGLAGAAGALCLAAAAFQNRPPAAKPETAALAATPALAESALGSAREAIEPALCVGADGAPWLAWIALDESGKSASLRAARGEPRSAAPVPPMPVASSIQIAPDVSAFAAPALAAWGSGAYLVFEAERAGRRVLFGCELAAGDSAQAAPRAGALEQLPGGERGALASLARGADGRLAAAWMRPTERGYRVAVAMLGPSGWSTPSEVAAGVAPDEPAADRDADRDEWCPRIAPRPAGGYALVWDRFDGRHFGVWAAAVGADGELGPSWPVTGGAGYAGLPDVAVDGRDTWWVTYETAKELGEWRALRAERQVALVSLAAPGPGGAVPVARELGRLGRAESPRVSACGAGPLLTFRRPLAPPEDFSARPELYVAFETVALGFAADGAPRPAPLAGAAGDAERSEALAVLPDGSVLALLAADERAAALEVPGGYAIPIEGPWRLAWATIPASTREPATLASLPVDAERPPRPAVRLGRAGAGPLTLLGDLHRHTTASRCSGLVDGTFLDALRYARGPGGLDFLAVTDHFQTLGRATWWRQQRDVARFDDPARTALLAGIEINVGGAGHQNLVLAAPTSATLVDLWREARDPSALRRRFPQALAIPHMTAALGNQFPPQALDAGFHRAIEVYQGLRGSYEGRGLPFEAADLAAGPSSVAALLAQFPVGLIGSSDHASSGAAFAGVHAAGRSAADVWEALARGACFAANAPVDVEFALDGLAMGESGPARAEAPVVVTVPERAPRGAYGAAPIAYVELVKNGVLIGRREGAGARELVLLTSAERVLGGGAVLEVYVRGAELRAASKRVPGYSGTRFELANGPAGGPAGERVLRLERIDLRAELVLELERDAASDPGAGAAPALELRYGAQSALYELDGCAPGSSSTARGIEPACERLWRIGCPLGLASGAFEFSDPLRAAGDVYWARVAWEDGALAWTSPIRVSELR